MTVHGHPLVFLPPEKPSLLQIATGHVAGPSSCRPLCVASVPTCCPLSKCLFFFFSRVSACKRAYIYPRSSQSVRACSSITKKNLLYSLPARTTLLWFFSQRTPHRLGHGLARLGYQIPRFRRAPFFPLKRKSAQQLLW